MFWNGRVKVQTLKLLEKQGVITPIEYSKWAAPIICIPKTNGDVCICVDYKGTINPWSPTDIYSLPKPQDLFASLAASKYFTKLDLTQLTLKKDYIT